MKAVDILGGVDLYVERNMNYDDPFANLSIHLTKGYQHLDGQKAGQYGRFRYDELGDIGGVQRQQRFLKALSDEMFRFGSDLQVAGADVNAQAVCFYRHVGIYHAETG